MSEGNNGDLDPTNEAERGGDKTFGHRHDLQRSRAEDLLSNVKPCAISPCGTLQYI
jgi:hypothetical protein